MVPPRSSSSCPPGEPCFARMHSRFRGWVSKLWGSVCRGKQQTGSYSGGIVPRRHPRRTLHCITGSAAIRRRHTQKTASLLAQELRKVTGKGVFVDGSDKPGADNAGAIDEKRRRRVGDLIGREGATPVVEKDGVRDPGVFGVARGCLGAVGDIDPNHDETRPLVLCVCLLEGRHLRL